ncbi:MAG: glycogen synthase GlgA [Deltaproteobacteria bacterium]|nr:glycogen synthase GlgA [Deltaproteobacteria bacterium]
MESTLKILFVSSEAVPYAKSGGLADVAGSLPIALTEAGMDIRIVMPLYPSTKKVMLDKTAVIEKIAVPLGDLQLAASVYMTRSTKRVPALFVHREDLFSRPALYGSRAGDYYDNLERFTFFCHAVLRVARELDFRPDIIHCHDWQTGLIPALLRGPYNDDFFKNTPVLFTIHNMGYQGVFPGHKLNLTGLKGIDFYHQEGLEYWGNISLLKSGIVYADAVNTVSPTYSQEICTREFGLGMEGILNNRKDSLSGILNGVDYEIWNPEKDKNIPRNYSIKNISGKTICKREVIKEMGLDSSLMEKPIFGMVSRLDKQKGLDLLLEILDKLMALDTGLILLGSGDPAIETALAQAAKGHPGKIGIGTGFNDPLAHRIIAGSDFFLIPSRYEPCGLTQMYALKYGTVPIVRATGGLNDTVSSYEKGMGNGFKFRGANPEELFACIKLAIEFYKNRTEWKRIVTNGMKEEFSWKKSADRYIELYRKLKSQRMITG